MALTPGTRLGVYEVTTQIGEGGMGHVYRAHDTRLNRDVALKVLPDAVANDPDRLARFTREAKTLASLNHPHIAAIYGLEESGGMTALVMELVEGDDLSQRITRGAIPIDEALPIAKQIAEALEAAHEQGIIHRDLKPANIKVRDDGTVKVLDFGLAKAIEPVGGLGTAGGLTNSPTLTSPALVTGVGVLLGTATYMSPEQAKGRPADKRSDIWAFGCVLYEMLTGGSVFAGGDVAEVSAAILRDEPDWSRLPSSTPASIQVLLRACLQKNPRDRIADISVARFVIEQRQALSARNDAAAAPLTHHISRVRWIPWIVTGVALAVAVAALLSARRGVVAPPPAIRLSANLGVGVTLRSDPGADIAISRDGTIIAVTALAATATQLFVRGLDQLTFTPLAGTDGAALPAFSPDGRSLVYAVDTRLYRVPSTGGTPQLICQADDLPAGIWWSDNDRIVFSVREGPVWTVQAGGGKATHLNELTTDERTQRWPQLLADGKTVIFASFARQAQGGGRPDIVAQVVPNGPRKVLVNNAVFARYVGSGYLVYVGADEVLYAVPFETSTLAQHGDAVPLGRGLSWNATTTGLELAVSETGTVVYAPASGALNRAPLALLDRQGARAPLFDGLDWTDVMFSPDGTQLAFDASENTKPRDVQIFDRRSRALRRFTFDPADDVSPVWSPDGTKIAFASKRGNAHGFYNLYWQNADGSGVAHRLTTADAHQLPNAWHPNGRFIAFHEIRSVGAGDIVVLPIDQDRAGNITAGAPQVLVGSAATELAPVFSAEGRWLAYHSNETGRDEIYVQPFPPTGARWQVSTDGGSYPTFSAAKPELLFASRGQEVMVARYSASGGTFRVDPAEKWPGAALAPGQYRRFSVAPDGDHLAAGVIDPTAEQSLTVVLHMLSAVPHSSNHD